MEDEKLGQRVRLQYLGAGEFKTDAVSVRELLDRQLVIGEFYRLEVYNERSPKFHDKYFATIADAWEHLPEPWSILLPSPEHLRKHALIKSGYCDVAIFPMKSKAEALASLAQFKMFDGYCLATVTDNVVTVYRARSQRKVVQDARAFYDTAQKVFHVIGEMIGVDPLTLYNPEDYKK